MGLVEIAGNRFFQCSSESAWSLPSQLPPIPSPSLLGKARMAGPHTTYLPMLPRRKTRASRLLRSNSTDAERILWSRLRRRQLDGYKFRRQYVIGPFIGDFVCLERRLVIEVDGGQRR